MIADIKIEYPSYNDDQLLDAAITAAKQSGESSKIIWDGADIHFSGSVTHECKGFGGINFNGSKIYMPDYDNGTILDIIADTSSDITVSASDISKAKTTSNALVGKIFTLNTIDDGNADMCLGYRYGDNSQIPLYSSPIIKASPDGKYETGDLYIVPENGEVVCYNVHEYPAITFEVCNGTIVSANTANMSTFVRCSRSNTHIHDFVLEGTSAVTVFHWGIFNCMECVDIEIDHISGVNPIQRDTASGYFLALSSVAFAHVHDIMVGDSGSWGAVGCRFLTVSVFERCYINRWDCHFAQFGVNTIKDCVLNTIIYGVGNGVLSVDNCLLLMTQTSADALPFIALRPDVSGVYDGDIIVTNCKFVSEAQPANLVDIWSEACTYQKPSNSKLSGAPKRKRTIQGCQIPDSCRNVIVTGTPFSADESMFENLAYTVRDCNIKCIGVIAKSMNSYINTLMLDGCNVDGDISDSEISNFIATGCVFADSPDMTGITSYALSGNIASNMASVNKHS